MYIISDGIYLLMYYVVGYRREIVMKNLAIAFPEKTEAERILIAKEFYKNFIDTFIETVKLVSISRKEFDRRLTINAEVLNDLLPTGQSVQIHSGHFFNWEFMNLGVAAHSQYPLIGIFTALTNKIFHRLMMKVRGQYGTILIPSSDFRTKFHQYTDKPYVLGLVADQNPVDPANAYWIKFFGKMTPFIKGPEKGAKLMNTAVIIGEMYKVKRGFYRIDLTLLTTTPKETPDGYITKTLVNFIEECVRKRPHNYLWSHRRWKFTYDEQKFGQYVIGEEKTVGGLIVT